MLKWTLPRDVHFLFTETTAFNFIVDIIHIIAPIERQASAIFAFPRINCQKL